jgi:hypothetical protein
MSRRGRSNRGRHRNASSPETRAWAVLSEQADWLKAEAEDASSPATKRRPRRTRPLPTRPPDRPAWMDEGEFQALLELRARL